MEKITTLLEKSTEPNPAIRVITRAIMLSGASKELSMPLNVQLVVNGVELPFNETCDSLWTAWQEAAQRDIETRATEIAREMIAGIGLENLSSAINQATRIVDEAIEKVKPVSNLTS